MATPDSNHRSSLDRFLGIFADVHSGEGLTALLLALNVFLFTACLVVFYFLAQMGVPLAIPFFIWIGVFSLMIVAQFWSFANVIYDKSEGERLFAIVGFGASLGAVFGARIADRLIEPIGIYQLFLLGAAVAAVNAVLVLAWLVLAWQVGKIYTQRTAASPAAA